MPIALWILSGVTCIVVILLLVISYDGLFQTKNAIKSNFPLLGRFRYLFHELRPFFRQYFGDDDSFAPRIIIEWILNTAQGKNSYFSFDKFDTTGKLHDLDHQMIHAPAPYNNDEMEPVYPLVGPQRKNPMQFQTYFYRSAMSLGSLSFEATSAMAKACADVGAAFNTGEGGLSVHHIPNVPFGYDKKYFTYKKPPVWTKWIYSLTPGKRLQNRFLERCGNVFEPEKGERDLFLFDAKHWLFYKIDWDAPLDVFPKPQDLTNEFGYIIFQVGSGLYGLRKKTVDGSLELDRERFQKITSFCRAVEIKLAQGAKQTGGILKAEKNTNTIAEIRGVHPHIDLVSPNRFPYLEHDDPTSFFDFIETASQKAGDKPVGFKIVISGRVNIEPFAKVIASLPKDKGPDFITVDGGDGGSATAPIALGILFGKKIYEALGIVNGVLEEYGIRDRVKVFASSKLYAPHMSARAIASGADAIGNARSIMIAGGCIRAGLCSGEFGVCPVGMATMKKGKRRGYEQVRGEKVIQIGNYIKAHNKGLIQVAAVAGVKSPHQLSHDHMVIQRYARQEDAADEKKKEFRE